MVPEPGANSLQALNQLLLKQCGALGSAVYYRKGLPLAELFAHDLAASLELPGIGFDPVRYESRKADKTGNILIDSNTYAVGPSFHSRNLTVGLRRDVVQILDKHCEPIRSFPRAFVRQDETIFEPASLLQLLVNKPRARSHSPLRSLASDPVRDWLETVGPTDRRRLLNAVDAASSSTGFQASVGAADILIRRGHSLDRASLGMLARRVAHCPELTDANVNVNLSVYDTFARTEISA